MKKFTLVGVDGNAYAVLGYVRRAMTKTQFSKDEQEQYTKDATSCDYSHLLVVSMDMLENCNSRLKKRK